MASVEDRYSENVDGPYYVDQQCIACGVCPDEAPGNFTMSDDEGHAYVYEQPEDDEQEKACQSALESCPVDAIGSDG
ncbi:MAG: ferredoxin [bacterium]